MKTNDSEPCSVLHIEDTECKICNYAGIQVFICKVAGHNIDAVLRDIPPDLR